MSPREDVAQELLETCIFGDLNQSYGAHKEKAVDKKGKSYWSITFAKRSVLDVVIKVYSENFILVKWHTQCRDMSQFRQEVFKNVDTAKRFLVKNFVQ